jgi:hypothetical protein
MRFLRPDVSIGDCFERIGPTRTVYRVVSLTDKPGLPLHVRLVSDQRSGSDALLISASALMDIRFFRRVDDAKTS